MANSLLLKEELEIKIHFFAASVCAVGAFMTGAAHAASTVLVSLQDNGQSLDLSKNLGMTMDKHPDMKMAPMSVKINVTKVSPGKVTFMVVNASKETVHEIIVSPIKDENVVLPYIDNENRVDEEKAGHLGEVSELDPGKKGSLTVDLKSGTYILYCNIPGHYGAGMWTTLKVQ